MFLQFYGLTEQPFGVTPDPRFLYMGQTQQEALSSLIYGIETGRGFMALIASPGSGKTTMLLQLMDRLRESARTAFLFQTHTNSEEFLRCLLADLDIEPLGHDLGDLQRQLGDVLIREAQSGKRFVVAIDEAQNLDDQVLEMVRMLSNFETPQAKLLQIILVGQPQLADKLASPHLEQLRQRVSIITHFPPLDGNDIPKYIDHRLRVAGYRGGELFTPAALRLIVTHSKGIPRNINNLCFQGMSLGYAKNQKKIDDATLREVIADLSLESLGTSRRGALEKTPQNIGGGAAGPTGLNLESLPTSPPVAPEITPQKCGAGAAEISNLHLESPRTSPPGAPEKTSQKSGKDVGRSREEIHVGTKPPSRPVTLAPKPITHDDVSPLDAVNLSCQSKIEDVNTTLGARRAASGKIPAGRSRKHSLQPILWFGLATLLGYLFVGPWLKSGLDSLDGVAGGGGMSPNGEATTTSAPAAAETKLPDAPTVPEENPSTLNKEAMRTRSRSENPAPVASAATSSAARGTNPIVPTTHLNSSQAPRPITPPVHEALPSLDRGYTPGSGRLIVESNISGARITLNGEINPLWTTPRLFLLPSGTYVVSVSRGASALWTRRVHVDEGREQLIMADIEDQEGGVFTVDTDPPGMKVFIDGKPFGPSRVETVLRPGWHVCAVIPGPGHEPLMSRFHLGPGEALTRRIRITSPAAALQDNMPHPGSNAANLTAGPQGGIR